MYLFIINRIINIIIFNYFNKLLKLLQVIPNNADCLLCEEGIPTCQ